MKKYAVHKHTDVIGYNETFYTETLDEAKEIFSQLKKEINENLDVVDVIEEEDLEYYVECSDSYDRIYIEEIK